MFDYEMATRCCHFCGFQQDADNNSCEACGTSFSGRSIQHGQAMTLRPGKRTKPTLDTIEQTGAYFG